MINKIVLVFCSAILLVSCSSSIGKNRINYHSHQITLFEKQAGSKVFFEYDSASLSEEAQKTLIRQAKWLKEHPAINTTIEGHCDERGTRDYNLALGEKRAHTVKDFLARYGIDSRRIETISYGKERPEVIGDNEASWSKNRRSVTIIK